MGRRRKARDLVVAMNGLPVATWTRSARGEQRFCYAPEWLARDAAIPVSLSMPLSSEPFQGAVVENFFDNLLPDNLDIRRRLPSRLGADSAQPFDLLAGIGGDCVGALQIHPADEVAPGVRSVEADALTDE